MGTMQKKIDTLERENLELRRVIAELDEENQNLYNEVQNQKIVLNNLQRTFESELHRVTDERDAARRDMAEEIAKIQKDCERKRDFVWRRVHRQDEQLARLWQMMEDGRNPLDGSEKLRKWGHPANERAILFRDEIYEKHLHGYSFAELASLFGLTKSTVYRTFLRVKAEREK